MPDASRWVPAYVGLGGNLDDPQTTLKSAVAAIDALPQTRLVGISSFYRSAPMGPSDQPDYCNAVVALLTTLEPRQLLRKLQAIEERHGRVRGAQRWGPRTLDLDILVFGHRALHEQDLVIPHPGLADRNFVLYPLAEIAPDLRVPEQGPVRALCARISPVGLEKWSKSA